MVHVSLIKLYLIANVWISFLLLPLVNEKIEGNVPQN